MKQFQVMDTGKSLRVMMAKNGISRADLAKGIGISLQTATTLRKSKMMTSDKINTISEYFGIRPSEFISIGE